MKFATVITKLNLRYNENKNTYTAYDGRHTIAKSLTFYGGVWKVALNGVSVDYYENASGEVVYMLSENASDTRKGLYFETAEAELFFLEQFENCINNATKMQELIRIITEA